MPVLHNKLLVSGWGGRSQKNSDRRGSKIISPGVRNSLVCTQKCRPACWGAEGEEGSTYPEWIWGVGPNFTHQLFTEYSP